MFNQQRPKVFGVKCSLRDIGRFFPTETRNFERWKMPKLLNFRFSEWWYFLNSDNTELKRSSKIHVSVSERHRWAVMGQREWR